MGLFGNTEKAKARRLSKILGFFITYPSLTLAEAILMARMILK